MRLVRRMSSLVGARVVRKAPCVRLVRHWIPMDFASFALFALVVSVLLFVLLVLFLLRLVAGLSCEAFLKLVEAFLKLPGAS